MGCFGDMTPTKQVDTTQTTSPPDWVQQAGQANYNIAKSILDQGFVPYTGQLTAPLSQNEKAASNLVATTAASGNPYLSTTEQALTGAGQAPAYSYDFSTVVDPNGPLGAISDYMDPYLAQVLAPTLRQIGISGAQARQGINANATAAGAYGDARHGVVEGAQLKNQAQQEQDATAQGFSSAFNNAMTNRQQDLSRYLTTQQSQQSADEQALNRLRQSGIDLTGLDQSTIARALGLSTALGTTGANERSVDQASNDAQYQQFLRQQGWTNDEIAFLTSVLRGTPTATTTTGQSVTQEPDNSGWGIIGSIVGSLASAAKL